jgi:S1-C subfamily serine protease
MRNTVLLLTLLGVGAARPAAAQNLPPEPGWIGVDAGIVMAPGIRPMMIVRQVAVGSPAEQAGLGPGDTLIALDGMPPSFERFQALRSALRPGDPLEVTVRDGGRPRTLVVRAARRPWDLAPPPAARTPGFVPGPPVGWTTPWLVGQDRVAGAQLAALNAGLARVLREEMARYFGAEPRGLLVIQVAPGTPAEARLRPGDVLLQVGGVPVNELETLRRAVAAARPDQALRVMVVREGREVVITLPR